MKFRFPIVIIDEDFRSENTSGLGIRALAKAMEEEGMEVLGVTSYGDLSQFAQQQSRASAFILSIDDEEFTPGPELDPAILKVRAFIQEIRFKNAEIPIYLYGETRTSRHIPNDVLRELRQVTVAGHAQNFDAFLFDGRGERADAKPGCILGAEVFVDDDDGEAEFHGRCILTGRSSLRVGRSLPAAGAGERRELWGD